LFALLTTTENAPRGSVAFTVTPELPYALMSVVPSLERIETVTGVLTPVTVADTGPPAVARANDLLALALTDPAKLAVVGPVDADALVGAAEVLVDGDGAGAGEELAGEDAVGIGDGHATPPVSAAMALAASTRPAATVPAASGSVVLTIACVTSAAVDPGRAENSSPASPATTGEAADVPLKLKHDPLGQTEYPEPGAATSTHEPYSL
jgi:hypothetical protein